MSKKYRVYMGVVKSPTQEITQYAEKVADNRPFHKTNSPAFATIFKGYNLAEQALRKAVIQARDADIEEKRLVGRKCGILPHYEWTRLNVDTTKMRERPAPPKRPSISGNRTIFQS